MINYLYKYSPTTKLSGYELFNNKYSNIYPNINIPNKLFLDWFIGFSEGKCSFIVTKNNKFIFEIILSSKDLYILNYIKNNLNMGNIILVSNKCPTTKLSGTNKTYKFIINNYIDIYLICLLFNGNMILPLKNIKLIKLILSYNEFILKYNNINYKYNFKYINNIIIPIYKCKLPSLDNSWISGFIDSEGYLISKTKDNPTTKLSGYPVKLILNTKYNKFIINYILYLFNSLNNYNSIGYIYYNFNKYLWELNINNIKLLDKYFNKYPLKRINR